MTVKDAIKSRRSIRKYKPGAVIPEEHIHYMLEAAMMAPSACNRRPWEFVVIKSDEAKETILSIHPYATHLKDASIAILVCARPELQEGIAEGYFPQDCGAAIQNILLAATDAGYGSCWCGIYPRPERVELFRKTLNLTSTPLGLVIIGTPDESPEPRGFYDETKVTVI